MVFHRCQSFPPKNIIIPYAILRFLCITTLSITISKCDLPDVKLFVFYLLSDVLGFSLTLILTFLEDPRLFDLGRYFN